MNRDEILALALEIDPGRADSGTNNFIMSEDQIVAFASRIESLVREEIAKECENDIGHKYSSVAQVIGYGRFFAEMIRKSEG